jgi:transcriptional regulator with XRE-family HTH domain
VAFRKWSKADGGRLQRVFERAGLSVPDVASALGWSRFNVSSYVSGRSAPPADKLAAMLSEVGGSADEVLGLRPAPADRVALERAEALAEQVLVATGARSGKRKPGR